MHTFAGLPPGKSWRIEQELGLVARKSSHKARRQRDDRAFAEFDEMMRRLGNTTRRETDAVRAEGAKPEDPSTEGLTPGFAQHPQR